MLILMAALLGVVAGSRTFTAPAAASWAARLGLLMVTGTPLAFMGFRFTPFIFTVLALGELAGDKLPTTPSRKAPAPFMARIVSGSLAGATAGAANGSLLLGLAAGALGAVAGTYGGAAARSALAAAFGRDMPAALLEDAAAIVIAFIAVTRL